MSNNQWYANESAERDLDLTPREMLERDTYARKSEVYQGYIYLNAHKSPQANVSSTDQVTVTNNTFTPETPMFEPTTDNVIEMGPNIELNQDAISSIRKQIDELAA